MGFSTLLEHGPRHESAPAADAKELMPETMAALLLNHVYAVTAAQENGALGTAESTDSQTDVELLTMAAQVERPEASVVLAGWRAAARTMRWDRKVATTVLAAWRTAAQQSAASGASATRTVASTTELVPT